MVGVPKAPVDVKSFDPLGWAAARGGELTGISGGFLSDAQRKKLIEEVGTEASQKLGMQILEGVVAHLQRRDSLGLANLKEKAVLTALAQHLKEKTPPEAIQDMALVATSVKDSEVGLLGWVSEAVTAIVEVISGKFDETVTTVIDSSQMGFFEKIQARIAERGSSKFSLEFFKKATALAKENKTQARFDEIIEHAGGNAKFQVNALKVAAGVVGMDVEKLPLVAELKSSSPSIG